MDNLKPDFIIVGAMKGGTSTLAYILESQKDIVMAPGEINYFDNNRNYLKGDSWYLKQFKSNDIEKFWGEKTATYHYDEKVQERIYKYNPDVKLIWILRNPAHRAYSNYWHRVKYGDEYNTFEGAIKKEIDGHQENIWSLYLKRSNYVDQIKAFRKYFDYHQMHIIIFEELINDLKGNIKNVLKFIGCNNEDPVIPLRKSKNITYLPSSTVILKQSRKLFGKTLPFKIIRKLNEKKIHGYPKINNLTEDMLNSYFRNSIEELEKTIHLDLSIWKQKK